MITWVFDEEVYPNIFTCSIKQVGTPTRYRFEISTRRNDRENLCQWVRWVAATGGRMVGYNNIGFDYPLLDYILSDPHCTPASIYLKAQSFINIPDDQRFAHIIYRPVVPQIDLYKIWHFDNKARATSLKAIQFARRAESIEDLPFPPGMPLTPPQMDMLWSYNDHDVDETEAFYNESTEQIRFREELTAKYNRDFMNHNDTKIGKDYFIMELERMHPGTCYEAGTRRPRQTPRPVIALRDIVFPWIRFKRPEFTAVLEWFKAQTITETKGVFTDIPVERLGPVLPYCRLKRSGKAAEHLNVVVNGFPFEFGTGGIHGSVDSRVVRADEQYALVDIDVESMYPSIGIVNRLYPQHLGEAFCDIYADMKQQRIGYAKNTAENKMLKLALNGVYGDSNNRYSPFYDPQYTMSITINGQLLLCLLADYLMDVPDLEIIQVNTDGVTYRCPREYEWYANDVCEWWQKHTRLKLERVDYDAMWIANVNNYIAKYAGSDKLKRKGAYEYVRAWHQDHSALVVPMAAEAAMVRGVPVAEFIHSHTDIMDFMCRAKVPRNCRLLVDEVPQQNIIRYFVSREGGSLVKVMPPLAKAPDRERRIGIDVGWKVTVVNRIRAVRRDEIDYRYYIFEAEKLLIA